MSRHVAIELSYASISAGAALVRTCGQVGTRLIVAQLFEAAILSYRDVGTTALPLFTSKALFVAGKGRFGFTKIGPQKCEGSRNFLIVWFLQPVFATVWSGLT